MGFRKKKIPTPLSCVLKKLKKSCTRGNTRFYKIIFIVQNCQFLWYFQRIFNFVFFIFNFLIFFKFRLFYRILMRVNSIFYMYQFEGVGAPICDEVLLSIKNPQNQQHCLAFHIFFLFFHQLKSPFFSIYQLIAVYVKK